MNSLDTFTTEAYVQFKKYWVVLACDPKAMCSKVCESLVIPISRIFLSPRSRPSKPFDNLMAGSTEVKQITNKQWVARRDLKTPMTNLDSQGVWPIAEVAVMRL